MPLIAYSHESPAITMRSFGAILGLAVCLVTVLSACQLSHQRVIYEKDRIEIGIERDPSTDGASPPVINSHPARLTEDDVARLLKVFQVSGYSGTLAGIIASARPFPVFRDEEIRIIAGPISKALNQAGAKDRIYFSLPNQQVRYNDDRTAGALMIRDPYLHFMLRDHSALFRTDTASGDADKDPRDTKGMRLSVIAPARVATLAPEDEPRWSPLEKAYTRVNVNEVLYASAAMPSTKPSAQHVVPTVESRPTPSGQATTGVKAAAPQPVADPVEDLRLQIRELTTANQELRGRLKDQAEQVNALQEELDRLKQEVKKPASKKSQTKPAPSASGQ